MTDFSHEAYTIQVAICEEAAIVRAALTAPHVLMKPAIYPDGSQWCALLGEDLATGIAGFGATPADAVTDFDRAFREDKTPAARLVEAGQMGEHADDAWDQEDREIAQARLREAFESCTQCGESADEKIEGVCAECWEGNQRALDLHNASFDRWEGLTDAERAEQIRRSTP